METIAKLMDKAVSARANYEIACINGTGTDELAQASMDATTAFIDRVGNHVQYWDELRRETTEVVNARRKVQDSENVKQLLTLVNKTGSGSKALAFLLDYLDRTSELDYTSQETRLRVAVNASIEYAKRF